MIATQVTDHGWRGAVRGFETEVVVASDGQCQDGEAAAVVGDWEEMCCDGVESKRGDVD